MIQHLDIIVSGNIADIGFCFQVMIAASNNAVKGNVRYLSNSEAKIEAEATQKHLDSFIESCKIIPRAEISGINIQTGNVYNYNDFEII